MTKRLAPLVALVGSVLCLYGTATQAIDLEDFYIVGGIVHTPEFGPPTGRYSFEFPSSSFETRAPSQSSSQTSLKFGAGLSINETWAIEAVAILGMEDETHIPSLFDGSYERVPIFSDDDGIDDFEIAFDIELTTKLKASILRINPVYSLLLQRNLSFIGKAGVAFIERDRRITTHTEYEFEDDFGQEIEIIFEPSTHSSSFSDSSTNVFASAGISWNPGRGQSAISVSFTNYFDTPGDITQSLEVDYQWKF
ncbi:MAG: hypothetical protein OXG08_05985 [Gammaproteobacteria bacterium]|nr:hypothetical protein [Gammaproteobacteria bacterium]